MANFHENRLVIAANEQDMLHVLKAMAFNLASKREETGYDDLLEDCTSAVQAYNRIDSAICWNYWLAFTPNPSVASQWMESHPDISQSDNDENAIYGLHAMFLEVIDSAVAEADPGAGRPLSESASVSMDRYGHTFVLQVSYCTAWYPNTHAVRNLFKMLPMGEYGVAFLDADEYDQYTDIGCIAGNHRGAADLLASDPISADINSAQSLLAYAKANSDKDLADEPDLAKVALEVAACRWNEYERALALADEDFDDEALDLYEEYWDAVPTLNSRDHETFDDFPIAVSHGVPWENPNTQSNKSKVDSFFLSFVQEFPKDIRFLLREDNGAQGFIDTLAPCSPLVIESYWYKRFGITELGIDVSDTEGHFIKHIYRDRDEFYGLGYLTPYLIVTAKEVSPFSTSTNITQKCNIVVIHIELAPFDFNEVLASIHERAAQPESERGRKSIVTEGH